MRRHSLSFVTDGFLIALIAAILVWPLFKTKYFDKWHSIESTFIADARFLEDHWPHPKWQPLWYGGTRFDYIYPPALRYGAAALAKAFPILPVRGYHIYTGLFYCLGIAGVYLLIRTGAGSRRAAWIGALAVAVVSPSYLLVGRIRADGLQHAPWRLHVLVNYGEGPHTAALAVLGFALTASFLALRRWRPGMFALAAALCALVTLNNFYGATALAMLFPILCWAVWIARRDWRVWLRAAGIAALAYGLTAFWLVPSYFRVTLDNLSLVATPGNAWSVAVAAAVAAAFGYFSYRIASGRKELDYTVFVCGAALFFALNVLGCEYFGFRVTGEPLRHVPELDLVLILLAVELTRRLWLSLPPASSRAMIPRAAAVGLVALGLSTGVPYLRHPWRQFNPDLNYRERIEYRIPEWMAANMPDARVLVDGSTRFWYNTWHDLAQIGGGSDQGMLNQMVSRPMWQVRMGDRAEPAILWLQAFGVDAVVIHDKRSQEIYHGVEHPEQFDGALPLLFDDGAGNRIYRVPRRFASLARVVDRGRIDALGPLKPGAEEEFAKAYVDVIEAGPDAPASLDWRGTDEMESRANFDAGQSLLVQASYDPAWAAYSGDARLPVRKDAMGQMLVDVPPGERRIRLVFETPLENRIGGFVTLLSLVLAASLAQPFRLRRRM